MRNGSILPLRHQKIPIPPAGTKSKTGEKEVRGRRGPDPNPRSVAARVLYVEMGEDRALRTTEQSLHEPSSSTLNQRRARAEIVPYRERDTGLFRLSYSIYDTAPGRRARCLDFTRCPAAQLLPPLLLLLLLGPEARWHPGVGPQQ